jgi:hypothetical protein
MKTDTSEKGLEALIVGDMTASGWIAGNPNNYDRSYAVDLVQLRAFVAATHRRWSKLLISKRTTRHAKNFWPGCKAKSPSAG